MAISQVSKGVFVITPNKVDTQGGKYTQLFTKRREEQWQMAQKQALMEMELGADRYKEEMRLYREQQQVLLQQKAKLDQAIIDVQEGRIKDINDARLKAFGLQQEVNADAAERMGLGLPSTSTSVKSGTADTKGTLPSTVSSSAGAEIAKVEGGFDDPKTKLTFDDKADRIAKATRSGGLIGRATESEGDRVAAVGTMGLRLSATREAELIRGGATPADAKAKARAEVYSSLRKTDPVAAEEFNTYATGIDTTTAATTGTGTTTTTTRTGGGQTTVTKRPRLEATEPSAALKIMYGQAGFMVDEKGELVRDAEGKPVPNTAGIEAGIRARQTEIDKQLTGLARPEFGGFDYITRARDIAAGRFGPTSPSPAYLQRNALQSLLGADEQQRAAILDQYRKSRPQAAPVSPGAPAPSVPETTPGGTVAAPTTEAGWESVGIKRSDFPDEAGYQAAKDAWAKSQAAAAAGPPFTMPPPEEVEIAPGQSAESLMAEAVDVGAYARAPGLTPGGQSALQRLADTKFAEAEGRMAREARIGAEIAAAERPFQIPFEERGGETVPFFRKPGGLADQRAMELAYLEMQDARQRGAPPMGTYPTATEPPAAAPVAPSASAPITPPPPAPSVPEVTAVPPTDIRPEAAALMTPAELEAARIDLRRRLEERAAVQQMIAEQSAEIAPYTGTSSALAQAMETQFMAPPTTTRSMLPPPMRQPVVSAAQLGAIRVPSGVAPTPPSIGRYTPGPVPTAPPAQAAARPGLERTGPIGMDLRRMPAQPEDPTEFLTMMREGKSPAVQRGEDTAAASEYVSDIKAGGAEEAFGGGKKGTDPKLDYLFKRVEAATALSKRDDKLRRLTASGVGKTAQELYDRNVRDRVPFTVTYKKITEIYANDREGMMRAHEVALALDIKADNKEPQ
jgi:hypothetical protein